MKTLLPGDRIIYHINGRRMRGTVADYLPMHTRGAVPQIPIFKRNQKRVTFIPRNKLRKLP